MSDSQALAMYELGNDDCSVITLGQLRQFINETCQNLPDRTPILLNVASEEDPISECVQILADADSVEFYNF